MDPTVSNLILKAGMVKPPSPDVVGPAVDKPTYDYGNSQTNLKMGVFMMISNVTDDVSSPHYGEAWSPYILRGVAPGETSWQYPFAGGLNWTSETFKVTGLLVNGLTRESDPENWVPLRWFVFKPDSFYQPSDEPAHLRFTSDIELMDPYSKQSMGYGAGWYDWVQNHGGVRPQVFFSWAIDPRSRPVRVEVLERQNYYTP